MPARRTRSPWQGSGASGTPRWAAISRRATGAEVEPTIRRLDAEQDAAAATSGAERLSPEEVVAYLRDLPRLWRDASPEARQLIAASLFEETSALGWRSFRYRWTPHAIRRGLGDVIPEEPNLTDDEMVLVGARGVAPTLFNCPSASSVRRRLCRDSFEPRRCIAGTERGVGWTEPRRWSTLRQGRSSGGTVTPGLASRA